MNCEAARAAIDEQFGGELPAEQGALLREHLTTCGACHERFERIARVDFVLERGGLSEQRVDALQSRIPGLGKPSGAEQAPSPPPPARRGWTTMLAAAAALVLVGALSIPLSRALQGDEFTPRGGGESWGVRAFCVTAGRVTGESLAGGTLTCASGSLVQFTYTAPEAAQLSIVLEGSGQRFFPPENQRAQVEAGIDQTLPTSTPVGEWLTAPQKVTARFTNAAGKTLAESTLTVTPR